MPIVWIANRSGHPYDDAKRFGELKALTMGDQNPTKPDRLIWELARGIGRYVKDEDFFMISGGPLLNAIAFNLWLGRFGCVKLLQFDAKRQKYIQATIKQATLLEVLDKHITVG